MWKWRILGLQPRDKQSMVLMQSKLIQIIYMKMEFSSKRREMLWFFNTNMAAMTSRVNQQYITNWYKTNIKYQKICHSKPELCRPNYWSRKCFNLVIV